MDITIIDGNKIPFQVDYLDQVIHPGCQDEVIQCLDKVGRMALRLPPQLPLTGNDISTELLRVGRAFRKME